MTEGIDAALFHVEPEDRETWIRVGSALKTEMGDKGFAVWDAWSQQSEKYRKREMRTQWRSLRPGKVQVATLFYLARLGGYRGERERSEPRVYVEQNLPNHFRREKQQEELRAAQATKRAARLIAFSQATGHAYLERKGFPDERGLVLRKSVEGVAMGTLIVPVRNEYRDLMSAQLISPTGVKKFLYGGRVSGGMFLIGSGSEQWACEGFATGLSVYRALQALYRAVTVRVAFSAANLVKVTHDLPWVCVVADNDESGAGEHYAKKTCQPWWMPPESGDANDYEQENGQPALREGLREFVQSGFPRG